MEDKRHTDDRNIGFNDLITEVPSFPRMKSGHRRVVIGVLLIVALSLIGHIYQSWTNGQDEAIDRIVADVSSTPVADGQRLAAGAGAGRRYILSDEPVTVSDQDAAAVAAYIRRENRDLTENQANYLANLFREASVKHNIPIHVLVGVAKRESNFNTNAVSSANARGIMQVHYPSWRRKFGLSSPQDLQDPVRGVDLGAAVLRHYIDESHGDLERALHRYLGTTSYGYSGNVLAASRAVLGMFGPGVAVAEPARTAQPAAAFEIVPLSCDTMTDTATAADTAVAVPVVALDTAVAATPVNAHGAASTANGTDTEKGGTRQ